MIHIERAPHCLANYLDNAETRQYNMGYQKQEESQNECEISFDNAAVERGGYTLEDVLSQTRETRVSVRQ